MTRLGVRPRAIACLLAALAVGALTTPLTAPPEAHAAVPGPTVDSAVPAQDDPTALVVLDGFWPLVPEASDALRISGRVVNTTGATITDLSVQLRRSSGPLQTRRQVVQTSSAALDPPAGEPADVPLPGTRVTLAADLPPGRSAPFLIRIPIAELGLSSPGTFVVAVEALGRVPRADEFDTRQGIVRTFVPWFPDDTAPADPVTVTWLWPLADWPARAPDGLLLDDQTPTALSPGGRLDALLRLGERYPDVVSWVVDPSVLQTAAVMTSGYQVQHGGRVVVGDQQHQAADWLNRLAQVAAKVDVRALPYADVDAAALVRADLANDVVRAVTVGPPTARAALGEPVIAGPYWAPFGRIDRPTTDLLASAGVDTLVLSAAAMPAATGTDETGRAVVTLPTSGGGLTAVLRDRGLSAVTSGSNGTTSDILLARQSFLAQTAVLATSLPNAAPRSFVVGPDDVRWGASASLLAPLLRATRTAPWLRPLSLSGLLADQVAGTGRQRARYGARARADELPGDYVRRVQRLSEEVGVFSSILADPVVVSAPFTQSLLRASSAAWRTEPERAERLVTTIGRQLHDLQGRVHVLSEGTVTLSGDTGRVPVTIVNDLDQDVTVGLTLVGHPALRLEAASMDPITVGAGKMVSVDVDAQVIGADPLPVDVQLLAPDGRAFGQPASITVTSTAYARAAAWVVAAAFVAIAVFVVVGVVRRIRTAHRSSGSTT